MAAYLLGPIKGLFNLGRAIVVPERIVMASAPVVAKIAPKTASKLAAGVGSWANFGRSASYWNGTIAATVAKNPNIAKIVDPIMKKYGVSNVSMLPPEAIKEILKNPTVLGALGRSSKLALLGETAGSAGWAALLFEDDDLALASTQVILYLAMKHENLDEKLRQDVFDVPAFFNQHEPIKKLELDVKGLGAAIAGAKAINLSDFGATMRAFFKEQNLSVTDEEILDAYKLAQARLNSHRLTNYLVGCNIDPNIKPSMGLVDEVLSSFGITTAASEAVTASEKAIVEAKAEGVTSNTNALDLASLSFTEANRVAGAFDRVKETLNLSRVEMLDLLDDLKIIKEYETNTFRKFFNIPIKGKSEKK